MKNIIKGKEPKSLTEYRCQQEGKTYSRVIFDSYLDKNTILKKQLLDDQGYICCYCMQRIKHEPSTKIEHFKPISLYPENTLDYSNLFVACNGITKIGEGKQKIRHCDTSKGDCENKQKYSGLIDYNSLIKLSECEEYIVGYGVGGDIKYKPLIKREIENILNLNNSILMRNRKMVWKAVSKIIITNQARKIPNIINKYKNKDKQGKYKPYCQMILYFLEKKQRQRRKCK
jgi:uncharacterized protein (TIGR02646 family)